MRYEVHTTEFFDKWLRKIKDKKAYMQILKRLRMLTIGHFGDYKSLGGGISELRIAVGKGYRIYYTLRGDKLVIILAAGNKDTQQNDINKARVIAQNLEQGSSLWE